MATHVRTIEPHPKIDGEEVITPESDLVHGNPVNNVWKVFISTCKNVTSGVWESGRFRKTKQHPDSMEFCYLISGTAKLTSLDGTECIYEAGDSFIVEPGFDGYWESVTPVKKFFVLAKCS